MKAFQFKAWMQPAELVDVPVPEAGPGEVLIRIGGAGVCHSDLHVMYHWSPKVRPEVADWLLPFTLGHENAGWIEDGDTGELEQGTPVVVQPLWNCGVCRACRRGDTNACDASHEKRGYSGGLGRDGGIAEYMVAPLHCLVPLKDLEPWKAAALTDAGLSSYHAVKRCLPVLSPDVAAVVIGIGGLGQMAVQFLRELCGAKIIAVDQDEKALDRASEIGADLCLLSEDGTAGEIQAATDGIGAMAVLDFVGLDATIALAAAATRKHGRIAIVGLGGGTFPFRFGALPFGCSMVTTMGGTTPELAEVVALAESGRVQPHIERYGLDQAVEAYDKLKNNRITGRAVLVP
jgi:propanol-preferring alcohol dehydrogenase